MKTLGSHVLSGFITEQVTRVLNFLGVVAILLSFILIVVSRRNITTKSKKVFLINLSGMSVLLLGLIILHPIMDSLLNFSARKVINEPHFYLLHRIYLIISAIIWVQGIAHIIGFLKIRNATTE